MIAYAAGLLGMAPPPMQRLPANLVFLIDTSGSMQGEDRLPLVQLVLKHARRIVSPDVVANMRVGLTDSGYFRHRGIPTVVYGPTCYNLGGVDEYVEISEVRQVFDVHLAVVRECVIRGAEPATA